MNLLSTAVIPASEAGGGEGLGQALTLGLFSFGVLVALLIITMMINVDR